MAGWVSLLVVVRRAGRLVEHGDQPQGSRRGMARALRDALVARLGWAGTRAFLRFELRRWVRKRWALAAVITASMAASVITLALGVGVVGWLTVGVCITVGLLVVMGAFDSVDSYELVCDAEAILGTHGLYRERLVALAEQPSGSVLNYIWAQRLSSSFCRHPDSVPMALARDLAVGDIGFRDAVGRRLAVLSETAARLVHGLWEDFGGTLGELIATTGRILEEPETFEHAA